MAIPCSVLTNPPKRARRHRLASTLPKSCSGFKSSMPNGPCSSIPVGSQPERASASYSTSTASNVVPPRMSERQVAAAKKQNEQMQEYIQATTASGGGTSDAEQLAKLADLHASGKLDDAEYAAAKAKVLG